MNLTGVTIHGVLIGAFVLVQTVVFKNGIVGGATPDVALLLLVFSANQHGSLKGEVTGFGAGLLQDFLSLAPIGFHALIGTVLGFLAGLLKGKLFLDPILMPVLLAVVTTLLKAIFGAIVLAVFVPELVGTVFSPKLGIEIGLNALIAPFLYGLLHLAGVFKTAREGR